MTNKLSLLSLSLSLLFLFHGCLARQSLRSQQYQNACQIDRLDTIEPVIRIKSEAGATEWWNPNSKQLQCAGVSVMKHTVEPNGLVLPSFTNAPLLVYVVKGRGIQGTIISGCRETYQDSQQYQSTRFRDRHQKIRRFREGDVIAVPVGVVHWCYNDGNEPLITVNLLDTSNNNNQLDNNPRRFHLAGNPEEEQRKLRKLQEQQLEGSSSESEDEDEENSEDSRKSRRQHQKRSLGNNIFSAMDTEMLAEAFNVDVKIIEKLQRDVDEKRGTIVKVKNGLQVIEPPRMEQEEREERRQERRRQQHGGRGRQHDDNGLEETFCSMSIKENIADPERADIFNPQAGRISTLNSFNLPILRYLGLSAERGLLHSKAGLLPQWSNAHRVCYTLRGSARVQVVKQNGDTVFDDTVEEGQILTVPQNFAFMKRAGSEGVEWVCFNTIDNAMNTPLAGRLSVTRAMPEEVVATAYKISREEARKVKFSNPDTVFFTSSSQRRAEA